LGVTKHQFHAFDLPRGFHLAQHRAEVGGKMLIFEHLDGLRADAFEQAHLLVDLADVHVQCLGQPVGRDAALDRTPEHLVLLNGRDAVDPVVVGVAFVVGGDQARRIRVAELLQGQQPDVAVEQDVLARGLVGLAHAQGFDQPNGLHRRHDLLEFARGL